MKILIRRLRPFLRALAVLGGFFAIGGAVALALDSNTSSSTTTASSGTATTGAGATDPSTPDPNGEATAVPADLASSFAILRRSSTSSDALPTAAAGMFQQTAAGEHYGVNPALARLASGSSSAPVWLVPGGAGSCLYDGTSGASVCGPNSSVESQGLVLLLQPTTAGNPATFVGILPDGVSATATNTDGSAAQVTMSDQSFRLSGSLSSVTVHTTGAGDKTLAVGTLSLTVGG